MLDSQSVLCGINDEEIDEVMLLLGWTAVRDRVWWWEGVAALRGEHKWLASRAPCGDVRCLSPLVRKQGQARLLRAPSQ